MNQKTIIKVMLDLVIAVLFITLLNIHWTGLVYHEIVGMVIFGMIAAHISLNWSWVKNLTKNLFNSRLKLKAKLMYILNAALLVSVAAITLTGIMISEVIFGFGSSGRQELLYALHKWVSYGCLGLFGVHIALHWRYLLASLRIILTNPTGSILIRTFKSFGATVLIIVILYKLVVPNLDSTLTQTKVSTPASKFYSADSNVSSSNEISVITNNHKEKRENIQKIQK